MAECIVSEGSKWHRWDVHIHAWNTAMASQFKCDLDDYVQALENLDKDIVALGITDYMSISGYEQVFREKHDGNRLQNIQFLFPNIEFRLTPPTKKERALNLHLLISPEESGHIAKIKGALSRLTFSFGGEPYPCTREGLTELGRRYVREEISEEKAYQEGLNQFKIDFSAFQLWFTNEGWLEKNSLVAVPASNNDGLAGYSDSGFAAQRQELQDFVDIILSGNPKERSFWLGQASVSEKKLRETYSHLKPCLHGSDAHSLETLCKPADDRYCWVKAEPSWEGLLQVVFEPEERVWIGPTHPPEPIKGFSVHSVELQNVGNWLPSLNLVFNRGLTAIIGPRGAGKTALLDILGRAASTRAGGSASFVAKAEKFLRGVSARLRWHDGLVDEFESLSPSVALKGHPKLRYLSQQFVNDLCADNSSGGGLSHDLIREIEDVVFDALPDADQTISSDFRDLRAQRTGPLKKQRSFLRDELLSLSAEIDQELKRRKEQPTLEKRVKEVSKEISVLQGQLKSLLGQKMSPEIIKKYEALSQKIQEKNLRIGQLKQAAQSLEILERRIVEFERRAKNESDELSSLWTQATGDKASDGMFDLSFSKSPLACVQSRRKTFIDSISKETAVENGPDSLESLQIQLKELEKTMALDEKRKKTTAEVNVKMTKRQAELKSLEEMLEDIVQNSRDRLRTLSERRLDSYGRVLRTLAEEKIVLEELHKPLTERLHGSNAEHLSFHVHVAVDLHSWIESGLSCIDLRRKNSPSFELLEKTAKDHLMEAWCSCDPEAVKKGMEGFLKLFQAKDPDTWLRNDSSPREFAQWVFSTDHIQLDYGISYEGVPLSRLSPGTKGVVLLTLYLAVDVDDQRPLLVDQPEENLDPRSVFEVLVPFFREAKRRRQVIIVTHNPNLVVATDAELVIVASAKRIDEDGLPSFTYKAGGLEDPMIRREVCQILEGGEKAFSTRERRYGLHPLRSKRR